MTIKNMPVICKMTVYWLSHVKYLIEKDLTSVNKQKSEKGASADINAIYPFCYNKPHNMYIEIMTCIHY